MTTGRCPLDANKEFRSVNNQEFDRQVLGSHVQNLSTWVWVPHEGGAKDNREVLGCHQIDTLLLGDSVQMLHEGLQRLVVGEWHPIHEFLEGVILVICMRQSGGLHELAVKVIRNQGFWQRSEILLQDGCN